MTTASPTHHKAAVVAAHPTSRASGPVMLIAAILILIPLLMAAALLLLPRMQRDDHTALALESAAGLYASGQYEFAAQAYQQLVQQGADAAAVYYNLGVAELQAGDAHAALQAFQSAQSAWPRNDAIRSAQSQAQALAVAEDRSSQPLLVESSQTVPAETPRLWRRNFSENEILVVALAAWCLLAGMIVMAVWLPRGRGWAYAGAALAAVTLLAAGSAFLL